MLKAKLPSQAFIICFFDVTFTFYIIQETSLFIPGYRYDLGILGCPAVQNIQLLALGNFQHRGDFFFAAGYFRAGMVIKTPGMGNCL